MRARIVLSIAPLCALALSNCGMVATSASAIQQKMRGENASHDINEDNSGGSLSELANVAPRVTADQLPAEDDIIWAPEDPDAPIAALEELWTQPVKTQWLLSYNEAMKASRDKGKPVLVWFTNSKSSPSCKQLSNELFSRDVFEDWADENVVRLRIDSHVEDDDRDRLSRKIEYVKGLKERYKILGSPVVLMLSPRGTVSARYVGYKGGQAEFYYGRLRQAHRVAMKDYGAWKEKMEKRGYRIWHDNRGRSVFAKLTRYHNGQLQLVEPDGRKSRTHERKLSAEDRAWIEAQKARRGIR